MNPSNLNSPYYHGLDRLRAGLMIIGVFWHAVSVLSPFSPFVYDSPNHNSFALWASIYPEHIFRMEAFFLVSGFLAFMIRERKGQKHFFNARLKRVLVPLLFACLGVNFLLHCFGMVWLDYLWKNFDMWRWVMHGWFLITLFSCACIDMLLPLKLFYSRGKLLFILMLLTGICGYVAAIYLNVNYWHFYGSVKGNLFNFFILNTVQFYPFYCCGALLFAHRQWLEKIQPSLLIFLIVIAISAALADYLQSTKIFNLFDYLPRWKGLTYRSIHVLAAGSIAFLLFLSFYRSQSKTSKGVRYLVDSAIVVYLVHHPLVIIFGWLLDSPKLSNITYYLLLVSVTLIVSYLSYEIIRRIKWLRWVFGLKV